jgi:peptide/nickel transport system substrate-binding protein
MTMKARPHARRTRYALRAIPMLALIALGALLVVTAAAGSRGAGSLDTVTTRLATDWRTFDFQADVRTQSNMVAGPGYDRLIGWAPDGKSFTPYLATSWKLKAKSVVFQIRRDAKCTDGHVLNAIDVLNSFKRFIDVPKANGSVAMTGIGGWGPGPYHLHANLKKSTFSLSLDSPYRNILGLFANLGVICPAGLAALQTDPRALQTAEYGSGPYTLAEAVHGDHITYKLRPEWSWGPPGTSAKTMPKTYVIKIIIDETTAANLLLTGGLDIASIFGADVSRLEASSALTHKTAPNWQPMNLVFNQRPGRVLADDEKLRQALMTAVDPKSWNTAALAGRGEVSASVFTPGAECYDKSVQKLAPKPSIDTAKQIMASDGYTFANGKATKNGQPLKLTLLTSTQFEAGSDYLDSVLSQLGIDLTYNNLAPTPYGTAVLAGNFDVTVLRSVNNDPSAGFNLRSLSGLVASPVGFNVAYTGGGDPVLNRNVNAGFQSLGQHACDYFSVVQKMMLQKHYVLPLNAWHFDIFARKGLDFPPYPTETIYPVYYLKAK